MATYTQNYNLKMPSGQDVPDVEDFNSNAEIIDNTLFKHITNTADAYEKKIYKAGERCIKYDTLWKAKNDIDEPEEWTEEHWEKTTIDKEIEESSEKVYVGAFSSFPEIGKHDAIYVDNSVDPALIYYWDGEKYSPAGGTGGGGGTGENAFDVTFTLVTTEWAGASSPYSQVISVPGIYQNKAIVYAMQSEDAQPTEKEKVEYAKITGISQNTDSVTFYAAEKPTADIVIRAFSGADTEQAADLSIIAAPFDAGSSYLADDYTLYEGQMYKFTENKDPGAWDTSKVTLTTVSDELKSQAAELASQAEDIADLNSSKAEFLKIINLTPSTINQPLEVIKENWNDMPDGIFLTRIICGTVYVAIIQRLNDGAYGSALIFGYDLSTPLLYKCNNGTWS